jgi:hypothetical protein
MLDQLMQLITQHGQESVVNNTDVPNEHNEAVMQEAGGSIFNGLQSALAGGGLSQIMNIFNNSGQHEGVSSLISNPIVQNIIQQLTGNLSNKFNLSPAAAQNVSNSLVPSVLSNLARKAGDPNDSSVDVNNIFRSLTGGAASGIDFQGLMNKFSSGLDRDGDGDTDLQDIIGTVTHAAKGQQGGGILDSLSGLFGK